MLTAHDCFTLILTHGHVTLSAASVDAGPYVIRVGGVPCGAFGFRRDGEPADGADVNCADGQLSAYRTAKAAFEAIRWAVDGTEDAAVLRTVARRACRASRKTWGIYGYGNTQQAIESHQDYVTAETVKAAA